MKHKILAIVLAAGQGKRMQSDIRKQYLLLQGKPVLYYALKAFQESFVDGIVLVTAPGEEDYCRTEFVDQYGFSKICNIIQGGSERYHSVYQGLLAAADCDYVMIHDGARPFPDQSMLGRLYQGVLEYDACVAGMPVKDTIKMADSFGFASMTPDRKNIWMIQTPQVFSYSLILDAYTKLMEKEEELLNNNIHITDDAMVVERFTENKVMLIEGSYRNIKITTPEDLKIAEVLLE